ncbi:MAG: thioredoxin family protein [bacterium]
MLRRLRTIFAMIGLVWGALATCPAVAAPPDQAPNSASDQTAKRQQDRPSLAYTPKALEATRARLSGPTPAAPDIRREPYYIDWHPYDEQADARAAIDAALSQIKRENKLLAIELGANWCGDCLILSGMMEIPAFKTYLDQHYVVVAVDIGRFDKNLDIPARWGLAKVPAAPTLMIIDPQGNWLNAEDRPGQFTNARDRNAQDALDYFHLYASQR